MSISKRAVAAQPSRLSIAVVLALATLVIGACSKQAPTAAAPAAETSAAAPAAPAAEAYPSRVFFGDTHLHTALSLDAGAAGAKLGPADAYRFAKGEQVTASSGQAAKLSRPLDFLVVTDHTDDMGLVTDLMAGKPELLADPQGKAWYESLRSGDADKVIATALDIVGSSAKGTLPKALQYSPANPAYRAVWEQIVQAAEDANDPGHFTAFIGYEWTSMPGNLNLHRNVVYRDGGDKARQVLPYTTSPPLGSSDPTELYKWMSAYQQKTGGKVLAISHNGNLSGGLMYPVVETGFGDGKVDRNYAEQRAMWERLVEATQMKGDSETHPFLSPNDEFANFERWDKLDLGNGAITSDGFAGGYVRSGLKSGLKLEQQLGVNPYKFGLVGSTDAHTALSTADEDNFFHKGAPYEPSAHRWEHTFLKNPKTGATVMAWEMSGSGYAAVWAHENTRASLWDAMQRRETYATTGPRMTVRFFGGWDFADADAKGATLAEIGYGKGVPMGGDLSTAPAGKVPTFLVAALKDSAGANLDRYQIVKGWLDDKGELHEQVYDVAWSGDRKPGADGKLPSVGDTVDVADASYENSIGAAELVAVWKDPDFDPKQRAFYYGRVIEIPTPRWTAFDAKRFKVKMGKDVPMTTTERAYTSPIWYTP